MVFFYDRIDRFAWNTDAFTGPITEIYQLAAFAAEWPVAIFLDPVYGFLAVGAVDDRSLGVHDLAAIPM